MGGLLSSAAISLMDVSGTKIWPVLYCPTVVLQTR